MHRIRIGQWVYDREGRHLRVITRSEHFTARSRAVTYGVRVDGAIRYYPAENVRPAINNPRNWAETP